MPERARRRLAIPSCAIYLAIRLCERTEWVSAHACKATSLILCREATKSRTGGPKLEELQNRILSTVPRPGRVLLAPGVDPPPGPLLGLSLLDGRRACGLRIAGDLLDRLRHDFAIAEGGCVVTNLEGLGRLFHRGFSVRSMSSSSSREVLLAWRERSVRVGFDAKFITERLRDAYRVRSWDRSSLSSAFLASSVTASGCAPCCLCVSVTLCVYVSLCVFPRSAEGTNTASPGSVRRRRSCQCGAKRGDNHESFLSRFAKLKSERETKLYAWRHAFGPLQMWLLRTFPSAARRAPTAASAADAAAATMLLLFQIEAYCSCPDA